MHPLAAIAAIGLALAGPGGEGPGDRAPPRAPPPAPLPVPPLAGERPGEAPLGEPPAAEVDGGDRAGPSPYRPERDPDGSRFLWFLLDRAGVPWEVLPAAEMLASPRLEPVPRERRRPGDVVWWKGFAALYRGERPDGEVATAAGRRRLADLERERGLARFLRLQAPPPLRPAPRTLAALGRTVRFANPDPVAWTEGEPRRLPGGALLSLRRAPLRDPGGGEAVAVATLAAAEDRPGAPPVPLGFPPEASVVATEETAGGTRRLVAWGGAPALRTLTLSRSSGGVVLVGACTASETVWRVVERECRAFLDSLGVAPAP